MKENEAILTNVRSLHFKFDGKERLFKMKELLRCSKCEQYTMKKEHCGIKTISPKPAKWKPDDKYGRLRREAKKEEWEKEGLL